jgi:hypothetical protein
MLAVGKSRFTKEGGDLMRFYTTPHQFYCGIDLQARSMYVCILSHDGETLLHRHMKTAPEPFLKAVAPYREGGARQSFARASILVCCALFQLMGTRRHGWSGGGR